MEFDIFTSKNSIMNDCLQELKASINLKWHFKTEISNLFGLLMSNIVIDRGCFLWSYPNLEELDPNLHQEFVPNPEQEFIPDQFHPDRTGYECYENHIHMQDLMNNRKKGLHHLYTGIVVADHLRGKLKSEFPSKKFRIIVSYPVFSITQNEDENKDYRVSSYPIFPSNEKDEFIKDDCVVRFHLVREGETIFDNIEEFKYEAMGVIEVN